MKSALTLFACLCVAGLAVGDASATCCVAPDNGAGTVLFPAQCPYAHPGEPMMITGGLPPGTTLELHGPLTGFFNVTNWPGGGLGGEACAFRAMFEWELVGTGLLAGIVRPLNLAVVGQMGIAPRVPGDPVQSFDAVLSDLQGTLIGDPDFDFLQVTAGSGYGMPPCPGQTTLTQLPDGNWVVESFFDITYRIDFVGTLGGILSGLSGSTTGTVYRETCSGFSVDWARLQWPLTIEGFPGSVSTVYGRLYIAGLTDQTTGNDPVAGLVRAQVGVGADGTDPASNPSWTWVEAIPNPAWDGAAWGEPNNDEYMADVVLPWVPGQYDYACRFSGDHGSTWTYADLDGTQNGYSPSNAGQMTVAGTCCAAPDNGSGTIDFPADCPYTHPGEPMLITGGLPPGTTLELHGPLMSFFDVFDTPGGTLGGEICTFGASFEWHLVGTGMLAGYVRHVSLPVEGEMHIGPRVPGEPVQSFPVDLFLLSGQITGDPDFDLLRVTSGTGYGMPSPGHTTLSQLPDGNWKVASFFDITYRIDFVGSPGGVLAGLSGTTVGTVWRSTCEDLTEVAEEGLRPPSTVRLMTVSAMPNPFVTSTEIVFDVPAGVAPERATLKVYDARGRLVRTLLDAPLASGAHHAAWDGTDVRGAPVASGVYFCRLAIGGEARVERVVRLK